MSGEASSTGRPGLFLQTNSPFFLLYRRRSIDGVEGFAIVGDGVGVACMTGIWFSCTGVAVRFGFGGVSVVG